MATLGAIIGWMVCGLIVGAIARALHPGPDPMGWTGTMVLGILGALLGGGVSYLFGYAPDVMNWPGWIMSIVGAIILLALGMFVPRSRRTI